MHTRMTTGHKISGRACQNLAKTLKAKGFRSTPEASNLEPGDPPTPSQSKKENQHKSSYIHASRRQ